MSQQLAPPQFEKLMEVADNLADIQQGLNYAIEIGRPRNKRTLDVTPEGLARRLREAADRLDGLARQRKHSEETEVPHEDLVEDLLRVADSAEQLTAHATQVEDIPLPMRADITDRLIQFTCFIRLLARQLDGLGQKTANVPVDA